MVNTMTVPGSLSHPDGEGQHLTLVKRSKLPFKNAALTGMIGQMFKDLYLRLCFNIKSSVNNTNYQILGINHNISIVDEELIEIILSAIAYKTSISPLSNTAFAVTSTPRSRSGSRTLSFDTRSNRNSITSAEDFFVIRESLYPVHADLSSSLASSLDRSGDHLPIEMLKRARSHSIPSSHSLSIAPGSFPVILTPQPSVPGYRIVSYLGQVHLHFVKDSIARRGEHSLGSFYHTFISEANAIVRAHVEALKGNALVNYRIYPLEAGGRVYRNQASNMLTLSGDAVELGVAL